jgi:hypothetical protein
MLRRLLNIASIACLVLCVALMASWVRSYHTLDQLFGRLTSTRDFEFTSLSGRLIMQELFTVGGDRPKAWRSDRINGVRASPDGQNLWSSIGFRTNPSVGSQTIQLPYWFLFLATGILAMLFQLRWPPWRFTLRSLFVVTTFLAVVLGMIAWLDRAWIGK